MNIRTGHAGTNDERFIVELTPEGVGPPGVIRIRRGLKILLRTCGLRCNDIRTERGPSGIGGNGGTDSVSVDQLDLGKME